MSICNEIIVIHGRKQEFRGTERSGNERGTGSEVTSPGKFIKSDVEVSAF